MKQDAEQENKHHDKHLTDGGFTTDSTVTADSYTQPQSAMATEFLNGHDLYYTELQKQCKKAKCAAHCQLVDRPFSHLLNKHLPG